MAWMFIMPVAQQMYTNGCHLACLKQNASAAPLASMTLAFGTGATSGRVAYEDSSAREREGQGRPILPLPNASRKSFFQAEQPMVASMISPKPSFFLRPTAVSTWLTRASAM